MRVLVADDDAVMRELLREFLRTFNHQCVAVDDGDAAWRHLTEHGADVVISDWLMPGLNGVQLCEQVRSNPQVAYPYFILLTARGDRPDVLTALRAGVDGHLTKPLDPDALEGALIIAERVRGLHLEILEARQALEAANAALDRAAHHDALTGLGNRLKLDEDLPGIHGRFVREGARYSIALFDIDHFKEYNDTHGHQAGDALLTELGWAMAAELRAGDRAYRYGGEEFLIVFPNATVDQAALGAERIRTCLAGVATHLSVSATLSAGIAGAITGEGIESVIGRADRALYRAKSNGRDQLVIDFPDAAHPGLTVERVGIRSYPPAGRRHLQWRSGPVAPSDGHQLPGDPPPSPSTR
jgi:diguanylate cyclase (GGDEF)-like protein